MRSDGKSKWKDQAEADDHQPFFLTVRQLKRNYSSFDQWYLPAPMGKNYLRNIVPTIAEKAGIEGHITNHTVRKTSCANNMHADMAPERVQQFSGHKRAETLNNYAIASVEQQKEMSNNALYGPKKAKQMKTATATATTSRASEIMDEAGDIEFINDESAVDEHAGDGSLDSSDTNMATLAVRTNRNSTQVVDAPQGFLGSSIFNGTVKIEINNYGCCCRDGKMPRHNEV